MPGVKRERWIAGQPFHLDRLVCCRNYRGQQIARLDTRYCPRLDLCLGPVRDDIDRVSARQGADLHARPWRRKTFVLWALP